MSLIGSRPRLCISHGPKKKLIPESDAIIGSLTPDVHTNSQPSFLSSTPEKEDILKLGKYVLFGQTEKKDIYLSVDTTTQEEFTCKVFPIDRYREALSPYWQVDCHKNIAATTEVVLGESRAYIFFHKNYGDLHSYVRQKKRLREDEAQHLFRQIVDAICHCHDNNVILRDLKLRKFVFIDPERTTLQLEGLEDAVVLSEEDHDVLKDKHGCPAYVSPEILFSSEAGYSGKLADVWSLGVMLYTMLVGRYPFHDPQPMALFGKIRRGQFHIPDSVSPKAKCLIRCLLRRNPAERLASNEIISHPWFRSVPSLRSQPNTERCNRYQVVPEMELPLPSAIDF
ncbi:tribbles homolog 2-like [Pomacea canaliculata]|uniref:tribbles homolog 2-like n=1 Tax=Pomacea canaliculata TaxID=400727 RepID=UPI000D73B344|nr:tribbles homolog 2-like [Pomacea canaliculata]